MKTKYKLLAGVLGILTLGQVFTLAASHAPQGVQGAAVAPVTATPTPTATPVPTATPTPTLTPTPTHVLVPTHAVSPQVAQPTSTTQGSLSNDRYYTNVDGNQVHSPAYSTDGSVPAGATAKCGDGTYSFSQHHSGTCSHHGGVAEWL
jgi:hypothetical protein